MTFTPSEGQQTTRPTFAVREAQQGTRTRGEDPAPAPGHTRDHVPADFRTINGWGADLDPANRPAVPRELPSDVLTAHGDVKFRQQPRGKVHVSNEYAGLTPVFGETVQPRGLSGRIRDYAYQYGEGTNRHWMMLLLADRIDVYESAVADILTGRYGKEKGWTTPHLGEMDSKTRHTYTFVGAVGLIGIAIAAGVMLSRGGDR